MRRTTVLCDRCKVEIDRRVEPTEVLTGRLPRLVRRIDLCDTCEPLFQAWLDAGTTGAVEPEPKPRDRADIS